MGRKRIKMMKKKLVFAFLMALVTTGIVTFVVIVVNIGLNHQFFKIWLKSWAIAYVVAVPAILTIAPQIEKLVNQLIKEKNLPQH